MPAAPGPTRGSQRPIPQPSKRAPHYPPAIREQAIVIAETTGNASEAARRLGVPTQRVSEWLVHPDNAELRLRIQGKRLEAALKIAEELPELLEEALAATRRVARSAAAVNNGTQARELTMAIGVLETICARVIGQSGAGRYGSEGSGHQTFEQRSVLPALE